MASSLGRASIVIGSAALGHRASLALAPLVASSSHLSAAPVGRIVGVFTSTKDASDLASGGVGGVSEQRTDDGGPRGNARDVGRMPIHALSELPAVVKRLGVRTALLTDAANAQAHAQLALDAGCTHVVNMTLATVHPLQGARMWHEPLISRLLNGSSGEPSFISAALLLSTGRFAREFSVVATLGRGGYGTVWRARNHCDGAEYAVKRVPFRSRSAGDRALREAQAMAALSHACPEIVRYYGSWVESSPLGFGARAVSQRDTDSNGGEEESSDESDESDCSSEYSDEDLLLDPLKAAGASERVELYLLMELIPAPTLAQLNRSRGYGRRVQEGRLNNGSNNGSNNAFLAAAVAASEPHGASNHGVDLNNGGGWSDREAAAIVAQVARALAHAHLAGYLHRDVSPANIFVELGSAKLPVAKLSDFGLCALHSEGGAPAFKIDAGRGSNAEPSTRERSKELGTFLYASPEQWRGEPCCASDVYSLGVVLAELLLAPFDTGHERAHSLSDFRARATLPARVMADRDALAALAVEMASPDPKLRPTAESVVQRAQAIASCTPRAAADIAQCEDRDSTGQAALQRELDDADALVRELAESVRELGRGLAAAALARAESNPAL
mmetsp:Transcript_14911/g.35395  ORF Transcript_14911/g.35395 Transcript_14911/m.35395 type:complete len:618 (+) Transcript_14911:35-1888(+)